MTELALCAGCQFGLHSEHQKVVEACPEDMLGGVICPCEGDCAGNRPSWLDTVEIKQQMRNSDNGG